MKGYFTKSIMVSEPGDVDYEAVKKYSLDGLDKQMELLGLHKENPKSRFYKISQFNSILYGVKTFFDKKINLVVMETKGIFDTRSTIFGTLSVNMMKKVTECPALAVPKNVQSSPQKRNCFPDGL